MRFQFNESGSRVLREWNAERAIRRQIAQRTRAGMRSAPWYSGVVGSGGGSGFAGAGVSRLTNSFAQWSLAINADLDAGLVILRARARQLCQNNEFGRRFLSLVEGNVVGAAGPTLQVRATTNGKDLDKVANDAIEVAFARWCKTADIRGIMNFAHLQRVGVKAVARDGETLIRIVRHRSLPNGIALQILEADRLDESINRKLSDGNLIRQGIEYNGLMQPQAYWIKSAHPGDNQQATPPIAERVPSDQVLHPFLLERAEQARGYTWLHAVLMRMQMLAAFEEAAIVAARVGASKMGAFTRKDDSAGGNTVSKQLADGESAAGIPQMSAEAGEFLDLTGMPGVSLETWNPEYPHANFESFLKTCHYGISAGVDIANHNLTGNMTGVNYSSARIAELSERDRWQVLQGWWIHAVTMPIFVAWLESALLRGEITFPQSGKSLPADKLEKFRDAARFQGRTWRWVDPAKDLEAAQKEIELGLNSRTAIAAGQGREFEDVVQELAQEKELLEAAGLPWEVGKPAPSPAFAPADPDAPVNDADGDEATPPGAKKLLERRISL